MNRIVIFLCLLLLNVQCFAFGDTYATKRMILEKIFEVNDIVKIEDDDQNFEIVLTRLRSMYAAIPLNKCILVHMSDELVSMAFEIYLSENKYDYINMLDSLKYFEFPENYRYYAKVNTNKVKLIQLIYFDLKNEKFIGKPEGFPLGQNLWMSVGYGDIGSPVLDLVSLSIISGSKLGCQLIYSDYIDDDTHLSLVVFRLKNNFNGSEIIKSDAIHMGTSGALRGCIERIEFKNIKEDEFSIMGEKYTECDCEDDCGDIKFGKHVETVELLNWADN
jgi:hypothetical protein